VRTDHLHSRHIKQNKTGYALVEVVVAALILGILAKWVVPQFSVAGNAKVKTRLRSNLNDMRTQIMVYRAQHNGVSPGYPEGDFFSPPTFESFVAQMTLYTDATGKTSTTPSSEFKYGPYMDQIPANPVNRRADMRVVEADLPFPQTPNGDYGWVYQPASAVVAANIVGADFEGTEFFDY